MKYIAKSNAVRFENSKSCNVYEYDFDTDVIDTARVCISGRYPEGGYAKNTICSEVAYVLSGTGEICIDCSVQVLNEGDTILINPNQKFFWDGNIELLITCTPKWDSKQYEVFGI